MKKYYFRNCNISVYTPGFTEKSFFSHIKNKKNRFVGGDTPSDHQKQNNKIKGKAKKNEKN